MLRSRSALAAAALVPLLALTACGDDAADVAADLDPPVSTSAPAVETSPSAVPVPAPSPTPVDDTQLVALTVSGGTVTGDTGRVPVALGDTVRITVTADVADEIHLHGYDLHQDTSPGAPATLEFTADKPGVFEVELEESRVLLTRLQVQ